MRLLGTLREAEAGAGAEGRRDAHDVEQDTGRPDVNELIVWTVLEHLRGCDERHERTNQLLGKKGSCGIALALGHQYAPM